MARTTNRLTALQVQRCKTGTLHDGGGLYLNGDHQAWAFRYKLHGRDRWHGLGPLHTVSLVEARDKARRCRQMLLDGIDPIGCPAVNAGALPVSPPPSRR